MQKMRKQFRSVFLFHLALHSTLQVDTRSSRTTLNDGCKVLFFRSSFSVPDNPSTDSSATNTYNMERPHTDYWCSALFTSFTISICSVSKDKTTTKLWPHLICFYSYSLLKLSSTTCFWYTASEELFKLFSIASENICTNQMSDPDKSGGSLLQNSRSPDVCNTLWRTLFCNVLKKIIYIWRNTLSFSAV